MSNAEIGSPSYYRLLLDWKSRSSHLEKMWFQRAYTKKVTPKEPSNFRPITLEPVCAKVFTSLIWNRMYSFFVNNSYIETNIQKGFWTRISGTIEHIETLTYMINQARRYQRNPVITLLDLKNAFGELDHNLITSLLHYHYGPDHIRPLIAFF